MSPILGIYASQISGHLTPPDTGAMFPLGMVQVGSGGAANVTFSSIPSTYKHLQIRYLAATQASAGDDPLYARFNNDSNNSNYRTHRLSGNGSSAGSDSYQLPVASSVNGNGNAATYYAGGIIDILDYTNTSKNKTIRSLSGWDGNGSGIIYLISELWINTSAITQIDLTTYSSSSFRQYSQFALYGIK